MCDTKQIFNEVLWLSFIPDKHIPSHISVADQDNFAPDPDPAWTWPNFKKIGFFFVIFISFKLIRIRIRFFPGSGLPKSPWSSGSGSATLSHKNNFLLFSITMYCCGFGTFLSTGIRSEWILTKIRKATYIFFLLKRLVVLLWYVL